MESRRKPAEQIRVSVQAADPVSHAGLVRHLESGDDIEVVETVGPGESDIVVLCVDRLSSEVMAGLRRAAETEGPPVVLVTTEIGNDQLRIAVEYRVAAVLPRAAVTADRLVRSVRAVADGGGVLPPSLVGELLKHLEWLQREVLAPNNLDVSGLSPREVELVRLMADGLDTAEIAQRLSYSERTVKNVIHSLTQRLNLRNRSHAVAYAFRTGLM